jgi:hypothetical protein
MSELPAEVLRCQVDSLRGALVKVLDTRKAESMAWLTWHSAKEHSHDRGVREEREHLAAINDMRNAEKEARLLLITLMPKPEQQSNKVDDDNT